MAVPGEPPEWGPASSFVQHTISSNYSTLQTHDQWQWAYHPLYTTYWVNRWYSINMDTIFSHRSLHNGYRIVYISWIGDLFCYFFCCQPASLACQPLQPDSTWYTFVDDNIEAAPFYRYNGKAKQPTKLHENHDLCMEWEPTHMESWQKQHTQSLGVPACRSLDTTSKIQGTW